MSFQSDNGYTPTSIETIMLSFMDNINAQFGTSYTSETFIGTNFYKNFYATAQLIHRNEVKTSEIFLKLTNYLAVTNEKISRPVNTNPGIVEKLKVEGFVASLKPPNEADAGKIFICIDLDDADDDYDIERERAAVVIKNSTTGGAVTQGTEVTPLSLSNGQTFDYKFNLPNRINIYLRLTITLSENNQFVVGNPDEVKLKLLANIAERYQLGKNFEPMKYFTMQDAPWASKVLLEWSPDSSTWNNSVYDANYNDLFTVSLANTILVEN